MKAGSKKSIFREYYVQTALGVSSVINLLPTIGVVGPHRLQSLYGIDITEPNLLLMMQHRAVLFGLVGGILGGSIWWKQWRPLCSPHLRFHRRVTDMSGLFRGAWAFNQPLDTWDVRRVTSMNEMFHRAVAFNQPLCTWDVRAVANMSHMFDRAVSFNQPLDTWDVGQATDRRDMFEGAASYQGAPQEERRDCAQKPTRRMGKRSTGGLRNEVGGQTLSTGVDEG
jgi:hypothetical protein